MSTKSAGKILFDNNVLDLNQLRFLSKKNSVRFKNEVLEHLTQAEFYSSQDVCLLASQLEQELRCFIPLSTLQIQTLFQNKKLWLKNWRGLLYPQNALESPTQTGIWVSCQRLPESAYVRTGCPHQLDLAEVTRVTQSGWHLAYYHFALAWSKTWWVEGSPGWLSLDTRDSEQRVFLPAKPRQFLYHWLKKQNASHVELLV